MKHTKLYSNLPEALKEKTFDSLGFSSGETLISIPTGSFSRSGDVVVYVFDINQLSLSTPFVFLVSVSVFMVLAAVVPSINSPDNSPLSHSSDLISTVYLFMKVSPIPDIILCG